MAAHEPSERVLIARLAAFERWKNVDNRSTATAPARQALNARFEREVDPDGKLDPVERARRAGLARKAYFTRLALKSAQARRARRTAEEIESSVDAEIASLGGEAA